ncbi:MAG: 50S ribosomal protein L29 [Candidatus Aminicenantes bacterium 4484_214]|nr:MAG: 50S ribosomal protein L29 [Candidatus Aminicenantes bacterium 4484_214]RLE09902.1 MAG: 50S ribosomal protein L29 [Candidatus Aminicenantes bacterium]HDJ23540.1 50S ribosomal protein L29 [Candidatus Aminicenantes bacterium]
MKARELREMSIEELLTKEQELKDQLFKLKFQHTLGQLENKMKMRNIKKDIARIKTIVKELELEKQRKSEG